jgi:hypothetical protein
MEACLLHLYFTRCRSRCLRTVAAAHKTPLPLARLAARLGLAADASELEALAEHHGLALADIPGEGVCLKPGEASFVVPAAPFPPRRSPLVDAKEPADLAASIVGDMGVAAAMLGDDPAAAARQAAAAQAAQAHAQAAAAAAAAQREEAARAARERADAAARRAAADAAAAERAAADARAADAAEAEHQRAAAAQLAQQAQQAKTAADQHAARQRADEEARLALARREKELQDEEEARKAAGTVSMHDAMRAQRVWLRLLTRDVCLRRAEAC